MSVRAAWIACSSRSATTPRKLPCRTTLHQPRQPRHRALVDAREGRADAGRADHPAVQHPLQADVVHEARRAGQLAGQVHARDAGADDGVLVRALDRRTTGGLALEALVADQLAVRGPAGRVALDGDDAGLDLELLGPRAKLRGGQLQQRLPSLGARLTEGHAGRLDRLAAGRVPLVRRAVGVAHLQADPGDRHIQLLGHELCQGRPDPRPQLDLAAEDGDALVAADHQPGVDGVGGAGPAPTLGRRGGQPWRGGSRDGGREGGGRRGGRLGGRRDRPRRLLGDALGYGRGRRTGGRGGRGGGLGGGRWAIDAPGQAEPDHQDAGALQQRPPAEPRLPVHRRSSSITARPPA